MDRKQVIGIAAAAAITAVVTFFVTGWLTDHDEGTKAVDDQHIRTIIAEELAKANVATIDGQTLTTGEAISKIHTEVTTLRTTVEILVE